MRLLKMSYAEFYSEFSVDTVDESNCFQLDDDTDSGTLIFNEVYMERIVNIHIEKLSEGVYLATSDDVQGLVAQGRTVAETIEIARDVARKLIEGQSSAESAHMLPVSEKFDYPVVIGI